MSPTAYDKPLQCTIKPPQFLSIGETQFHSGCAIIEILFPNLGSISIGKITFVNNYTAHLSVKMKVHEKSSNGQSQIIWKTGVRNFKLMPNPHCEQGSQAYFTLWPKDFCRDPTSVSALRFVLHQPSPNWKAFSLEEIYVFPATCEETINTSIPKWLTSSQDELHVGLSANELKPSDLARVEGLPDPDDVSLHLHQLLMLAEKTEESAPTVELGRFDVDGCYEINLLSYT